MSPGNISSIGGVAAFPLAGWYYASKDALEGWTDALRQEVIRFGIRVVLIGSVGYLAKTVLTLDRLLPDRLFDLIATR